MAKLKQTAVQNANDESLMNADLTNPLTGTGKEVMSSMVKQYGAKKGKRVFYSSINKGKPGSRKWHEK